jgi:hypothetical protein
MTDVGATTWMTKDIVGLMQMTGGIVDMIETMKGTSVTLEGNQESKKTWIGIGTVLSLNTAGTQE